MKIGLNLLFLIPGRVGGIQTYAVSLIEALAAIDTSNEYYIFLNREGVSLTLRLPDNFHMIICNVWGRSRVLRYAWEQIVMPFQLRSLGIDVVHSLGYVGPLLSPCPAIVTIPDINFIASRSNMPFVKRIVLRFFSTQSGLRSNHVITISNFSKAEIVRALKLDPGKISVTLLGSKERKAQVPPTSWDRLAYLYSIRGSYIVAFGGGALHKNVPRLIEAYASLPAGSRHQLVIIGRIPAKIDVETLIRKWGLSDKLVTTGYVPEEHILPLLEHAELFVLPSLYEGFGLPLLEAQQSGVPIVCSSSASLPEVGGTGALYFDPTSVPELAQALQRSLTDAGLRSRLLREGSRNLCRFSWKKTAQDTLKIYQVVFNT